MMWTTNENSVVKLFLFFGCYPNFSLRAVREIRTFSWTCWNQMKMLEICLKLVGCKSKKGLSSSSSCYFEGKRLCRKRVCVCVCVQRDGSEVFWWKWQACTLGSSVVCLFGKWRRGRARETPDILAHSKRKRGKKEGGENAGKSDSCLCLHTSGRFFDFLNDIWAHTL